MLSVSIVIPVYRDADALERTFAAMDFGDADVIVAETRGDASLALLRAAHPGVVWVEAAPGRAGQMNAGAAIARGQWLLFLHADTRLLREWRHAVEAADRDARVCAGCFRFALDSGSAMARAIEIGVRLRVGLLGLPYGDQTLFVRRGVFEDLGGYAELPIMEDLDLGAGWLGLAHGAASRHDPVVFRRGAPGPDRAAGPRPARASRAAAGA